MVSKSVHLGSRLEPKSHNKSTKYIPGSSLENHLKKDAQHSQTRPLETMKSSVWCNETIGFAFPAFQLHFGPQVVLELYLEAQ